MMIRIDEMVKMGTLEEDHNEMRERVAALEHEQWVAWSKEIANVESIQPARLERWKKLWVPYEGLPESMKEEDRKWADKAIQIVVDHIIYL